MNTRNKLPLSLFSSALIAAVCSLIFSGLMSVQAQAVGSSERERTRTMLNTIKEDIKKHYYDPNFRGRDLYARFGAA